MCCYGIAYTSHVHVQCICLHVAVDMHVQCMIHTCVQCVVDCITVVIMLMWFMILASNSVCLTALCTLVHVQYVY